MDHDQGAAVDNSGDERAGKLRGTDADRSGQGSFCEGENDSKAGANPFGGGRRDGQSAEDIPLLKVVVIACADDTFALRADLGDQP